MKTVVCRKTGNTKSISVNTSYTTISETEKRYTLVNDKGIQANYCKSLFTEEEVVELLSISENDIKSILDGKETESIPES